MATNEEEFKNKIVKSQGACESQLPRLTDLAVAVLTTLESNHASAQEVATVSLRIMLETFCHVFGETKAEILAEAIDQVLAQLGDDPLTSAWIEHTQRERGAN